MTSTRNELRNRKSGEVYTVNSPTSLTKLNKQSVFAKQVDYSQIEEFIQFFLNNFASKYSQTEKDKIAIKLREDLAKTKDVTEFINKPEKIYTLVDDCLKQPTSVAPKKDPTSIIEFLKILGPSLVTAKLNLLFPGLATVALQFSAAAANTIYHYHAHQPDDGQDLCAGLTKCIQGFLSNLKFDDGRRQQNLPQIARIIENEAPDTVGCIEQEDLQSMLGRAYRGPNGDMTNCEISASTPQGGNITVTATKVDPITCDIMQDSLIGFTDKCTPPVSSPNYAGIFIEVGLGAGALAILAFALYKYVQHRRHQEEYQPLITNKV